MKKMLAKRKRRLQAISLVIWSGLVVAALSGLPACSGKKATVVSFKPVFPPTITRTWIGPDFWANRLQDWRLKEGQIECLSSAPNLRYRTLHLLTYRLEKDQGDFRLEVTLFPLEDVSSEGEKSKAAAGFLIGAGAGRLDHRKAALIHHSWGPLAGVLALVETSGRLVFRDMSQEGYPELASGASPKDSVNWPLKVELTATEEENGYRLTLKAYEEKSSRLVNEVSLSAVAPSLLRGNVALVSHPGEEGGRFAFRDFQLLGTKFSHFPEDNWGPILSTQYTLSRRTLKLTAQFMPLGERDNHQAELQILAPGGWETIQQAPIDPSSYTATFKITDWDESKDAAYRVHYALRLNEKQIKDFYWQGTIRHNPVEKEEIILAAFTGNRMTSLTQPGRWGGIDAGSFPYDQGIFFPQEEVVNHVAHHKPDILFFSGDQIYEGGSPTRKDTAHLHLDYLYKWYLFCLSYRSLTRDIPSIIIPDDHDVFHGNLWGCGGRATQPGLKGAAAQDSGGYVYPPEFVNMVQRTQTSHLPDPYDPTPALQGISVYYTEVNYGGVSLAVVEDRKFKSAPKPLLPQAKVWNGWAQNPAFNPKTQADVPQATLLGKRQLEFLEKWAADWSNQTWMKVVLSQTIFANLATLPRGAKSGSVIPSLPILEKGEYPENYVPVADMDSNGWPPSGRRRALRVMRKAFAFHVAGDQHLGSTIQYGLDDWHDASFALCVPSVVNAWPRRWFPPSPGRNHRPGAPRYTGDYEDGFGNKMSVYAVANPYRTGRQPAALYDLATGYGIVRMNRRTREIVFENWPRWADPAGGGRPYDDWPVTFHQLDNYGGRVAGYLPQIHVTGLAHPVIQVINETTQEIVYTLRLAGNTFSPPVYQPGQYTLKVGEPDKNLWQTLAGLKPSASPEAKKLTIQFKAAAPKSNQDKTSLSLDH